MRKIALVLLPVLAVAGAAAIFVQQRVTAYGEVPASALALEQALAQPGLVALLGANIAALVELEAAGFGTPRAEALPDADPDSPFPWLAEAGVDVAHDVSHLTAALVSSEGGEGHFIVGAFGSFSPERIEAALRSQTELAVTEAESAGQRVLEVVRTHPETCEESGPWLVHLGNERVLVSAPDAMAGLLADANGAAEARDLGRFQSFRQGKLVSLALFVPETAPDLGSPMASMSAAAAHEKLTEFQALYAGAGLSLLPPALRLESVLAMSDPAVASSTASGWQQALAASRADWATRLPSMAKLYDHLTIGSEASEIHTRVELGREAGDTLRAVPGELVASLFGGGMSTGGIDGQPATEQVDEDPLVFQPETSVAALPPYDPSVPFGGAVDASLGPAGVRVTALRLAKDAARGPEIALEAVASRIPNLGDRGERALLHLTRAVGRDGNDLLAAGQCGADRNEAPAILEEKFSGLYSATKTAHLRPGTRAEDVARLEGELEIRLPVRTRTVRMPAEQGQVITIAGAQLELTRATESSISFKVSGDTDALLHLRANNAKGQPLSRQSYSSSSSLFGGGHSGSNQYAGVVAEIEAIFAEQEEVVRLPFQIAQPRPGTAGEHEAPKFGHSQEPDALARAWTGVFEAWVDGIARKAAAAVERIDDGGDAPLARTRSGPFDVTLEGVWAFGGLMPRFEVRAPEIPGLAQSPAGVELRVDAIHLQDGSVHRQPGGWSDLVSMNANYGKSELKGSARLQTGAPGKADDVAQVDGVVVLRLPRGGSKRNLGAPHLGTAIVGPGLNVQLAEIGRDRLVFHAKQGAARVLGLRAWNAQGTELWVPHQNFRRGEDGVTTAEFQVNGVAAQIELQLAEELGEAEYAFVLRPGAGNEVAATR